MQRVLSYRLPRTATAPFCAAEIRHTIPISASSSAWARFRRYAGIGFLVSVGYMDPGNWATDIEAGSRYGYALLCVVLLSSLIAMLLQTLCVRLGMATGRDLAQLCRERYSPRVNSLLWVFAQIAIVACDFAEVLGTALALKLLFGLPLVYGVALTGLDTVVVLALQGKGVFRVETFVMALVLLISLAFAAELILSAPDWSAVAAGFIPDTSLLAQPEAALISIGILGATVMPHNLYLHSSAVGTRQIAGGLKARRDAIRLLSLDTCLTLTLAFFVNAAILIVAGSVFHQAGYHDVKDIGEAQQLLTPLLGQAAGLTFAMALLASGQSSTLTGTLAGQVILEGFLRLRIPCWKQRLLTRAMAILPALVLIIWLGEGSLGRLLVLSQVVLSLQLPFAVIPLITFCSSAELMGPFRLSMPMRIISSLVAAAIITANCYMLYSLLAA